MYRLSDLPGGYKNLSGTVRVIDVDGRHFRMTIAEARTLATQRNAKLVYLTTGREPIFKLVDKAALPTRKRKKP